MEEREDSEGRGEGRDLHSFISPQTCDSKKIKKKQA